MRVLMLITDAFGSVGGIAQFNRDFIEALCSYEDVEEVVAIPRIVSRSLENFPDKLQYPLEGINNKIKYLITVFKHLIKKHKFDLIICGHLHLSPLAALIKRLFGIPESCLVLYGIEAWEKPHSLFTRGSLKSVDRFISISDFTRNKFISWSKINSCQIEILSPCVDLARFHPGPKNQELLRRYGIEGKKIVMTVARMHSSEKYKGIDEVIEALPEVLKAEPNLVYLVVGEGDDRERLQKKVRSLGIEANVIFTGFIPEEEKVDHYRLADAYAMPGYGEGFGIAYLEAMACGVPVLSGNSDGGLEAVKNNTLGYVVVPQDLNGIKDAILRMLREAAERSTANLMQYSREVFRNQLLKILGMFQERANRRESGKTYDQ